MFVGVGNIVGKSNSTVSVDYAQAFFDRVTAAGGSLTLTEKSAIIQLISTMNSIGIWNIVKAAYPMVGGTNASCKQNLMSAAFTGTFFGGWSFSSTGATPNGTDAYMDTGFIEANNLTLNSGHIAVYSRTNSSGDTKVDIGAVSFDSLYNNTTALNSKLLSFAQANITMQSDGGGLISVANSLGFLMGNRVASSEVQAWKNGSKNTLGNLSRGLVSCPIYIGAKANSIGPPIFANDFSDRQTAFNSIGDSMSDAQALAYYNAIQVFQTTLGRQV